MKLPSENAALGEIAGLKARDALGLTSTQPLDDLLRALERTTAVQVFVRPLGADGVAGAFLVARDRPFILVNGSDAPVRQRFTLAHEFGHFWLQHGSAYDEQMLWSDSRPKEVRANCFAAAFLMPAPAMSAALTRTASKDITFDTLVRLATEFGVSAKAMRIRLETLECISARQIKEFDQLIDADAHHGRHNLVGVSPVTDSLAVARDESGRMPPSMVGNVLRGIDRNLLGEDEAAKILRTDPQRLDVLRGQLQVVPE